MKAVIFDRDGVLIDSESTNVNSVIKAFKELGITISDHDKDFIVGRHPDSYKNILLDKYSFSYEQFRILQRKIYYELIESTPLFDKTINLIKELHELKIPLALNTSSSLNSTLEVLKKADLENVFDVVVTFEDYEKRKPDPDSYIITSNKLKIKPEDCVVIEDSQIGLESAKSAGMKCIAIPNEYTKNQDLSKADLIIDSEDKINMGMFERF